METDHNRYIVQVYVGALSALYEALSVEASKQTTAEEIVSCITERLSLHDSSNGSNYELAEVIGDSVGRECKERSLAPTESPVQLMMLWPRTLADEGNYKFCLRERLNEYGWRDNFVMDPQLIKDYFHRFLYQPKDREYPDLCQLPDLNEATLLENLRNRFFAGHIYTYVGSILIAVNPFKFFPIYNPKYVKLYQNRRLGPNLPPHIFAVADTAYHCMLKDRKNQCIVISGESGSGKTESTNFLLHHLTALSQKGSHGSGVEQTILSAGPVLEAFGNAKTAHNNNSSRFGKFIQVNYKENGMVHGAVVQKYLLEKSRICTQGRNERNYHVFYYLLEGASESEKQILHLKRPDQYYYLNKSKCSYTDISDDLKYEFSRLKQSMEMVGFTAEKQKRLFSVLSAVLLLGNVEFQPRKSYHHDESVGVKNPEIVTLISQLLRVKQETLMQALTAKRARASGETLVINYKLPEAIASRDAMAKCLYGALFDWIVLQVNHALLSKKDTFREHQGNSIGVLDIFGFEDFGVCNSFEQLCINYANEHLQHYFNQHVFKYEQEEYRKEGIRWKNIDFMDNTGCLQLIEGKINGLLCLLDDQCNFPCASNETLLEKFNKVHSLNKFYAKPQRKEGAFMIVHYAGTVKYQVTEMLEKNLDLMRQDIVGVLKNSSMAFVRELVGADPVAVFRWAIVRAFFRSYFAFQEAGRRHRRDRVDGNKNNIQQRYQRNHVPNENVISKHRNSLKTPRELDVVNYNRVSMHTFYNRSSCGANMGTRFEERAKETVDNRSIKSNNNKTSSSAMFDRVMCPDQAKVMQRANQIVMKNKSFRPRDRGKKGLKNLQSVKTLVGRTGISTNQNQVGKARKQFMTVTAQFQQSLHSLMDTLNQANPFFIRCIKSNSQKIPNNFHEDTVQRQLRYTGMLETVRIRRAGFNVRLTYDEFIQLYRILLPKGLLSSQSDVKHFLATLNLDRDNYQLGSTKIFLRESEKYKLDCKLHQQIMASIVTLQRWFRAYFERRRFLRIQHVVITLQSYCRMYLVQKQMRTLAAVLKIQKIWRGYKARVWYYKLRKGIVPFQAHARGYQTRKLYGQLKTNSRKTLKTQQLMGSKYCKLCRDELFKNNAGRNSEYESELKIQSPDKTNLRVTQSLPAVTSSSQFYCLKHQNRLDSLKTDRLMKQVNKHHMTIDLSDIECTYDASKVADLLLSATSLDSINNIDEHTAESRNFYEPGSSSVHSPYRGKSEQRDDRGNTSNSSSVPSKLKREHAMERFISMPPIRHKNNHEKEIYEVYDNLYTYEQAPDKARQMLGAEFLGPVPPTRRTNRRSYVKSLGEEVMDSTNPDKSLNLGTISERHLSETYRRSQLKESKDESKVDPPVYIKSPKGLDLPLRRRNSDPATKVVVSEHPEGVKNIDEIEYKKNIFLFAGHRFGRVYKYSEEDRCESCNEKMDAFSAQGYKCQNCKRLFHTKCIQNKKVLELPCDLVNCDSSKPSRRKPRKPSRAPYDNKQSINGNFNLTGTSEFTDRTDKIISGVKELTEMQDFITMKISKIEESEAGGKGSEVDTLFKQALREFKDNLVQLYSAANKNSFDVYNVKYKDLITNFMQAMDTVCQKEQKDKFPVTMGVNAFRGFMNEFMNSRAELDKPTKAKRKKEKKRKGDEPIAYAGHTFLLTNINIPTVCEICSSFFMWPIERCLVCQACKMTCHKKCYVKTTTQCTKNVLGTHDSKKVFGVPLVALLTDDCKIPVVIERLLATIEMHSLYTEGLYRKSGASSKVKELKNNIEENKNDVNFENFQVHVLASVLKSFLREMPEPLLTFECYENFITVANMNDPQDRVSTLYEMLKKLPAANYDLMERLIFHLARVALHEEVNRMSAASLAIVFAPCILRTNKVVPAQDSLQDIGSQTQCIEIIISEQMRKIRNTLDDIDTLDTACQAATNRLSSLRSSKVFSPEELLPQPQTHVDDEENLLENHIHEIQKEKELLTSTLPVLTHANSDDDMLSTDGDGSLDDISSCVGEHKRLRIPIIRSVSSGEARQSNLPTLPHIPNLPTTTSSHTLKRQSSSDVGANNANSDEYEDTPIMV